MRYDVSGFGELEKAIRDYRASGTVEALVLVLHTPGHTVYRFVIGEHGIVRQDCTANGEARE